MRRLPDDNRLLAVAASVSDGTEIDWDEVKQETSTDDLPVLEQLRILHDLAAAHVGLTTWGSLSIIEPLGEGSFATVYRAFDPDLQRDVALKIIRQREGQPFEPEHAVDEARRLARVRHPNVVTVFGAERRDGDAGIEMELVRGQTLHAVVAGRGSFSATEAALIGIDVCGALAAVHAAGLLHGDIKAHNVMREEGGRIVLMDLGAARDLSMMPAAGANDFAGTPLYVAPEVFRGLARSRASDIYSLGVLLFYLATGAYPVEGDTRTQIDRQHQQRGVRRRLRDVRPDLPEPFIRAVERALEDDPAARYQSAGAFEATLRSAVGRPAVLHTVRLRQRATVGAGTLAAALLIGLGYWGFDASRVVGGPPSGGAAEGAVDVTAGETPGGPAAAAPSAVDVPYRIEATFYRATEKGPVRLGPAARIAPGDRLFARIQTSVPAFVYVVNEDDLGILSRLFPLGVGDSANPIPAGRPMNLPGRLKDGEEWYWEVSTSGGREHFIVFVSPVANPTLESTFASFPSPLPGMPVIYPQLSTDAASNLRSIGGLAPAGRVPRKGARLSEQYTTPLPSGPEDTVGLWVRTATFENPQP